ncbi:hypothetical protein CVT24_007622 [Panaeolus cyanescens]|uniref:Uncharacterized protein n=1 Tax=Panaeolus cyanescens TaxID=181874 RepID=A0A409W531_9AGAR|nr:hypothetical protein CVT24_007622 [Panaeolus cyanescens]
MMSIPLQSPTLNAQSILSTESPTNSNYGWSRSSPTHWHSAKLSESQELVEEQGVQASFSRPGQLPDLDTPSKSSNNSPSYGKPAFDDLNNANSKVGNTAGSMLKEHPSSTPVVQPGSNRGTQDLVAALNNCFAVNELSPSKQSESFASPPPPHSPTPVASTSLGPPLANGSGWSNTSHANLGQESPPALHLSLPTEERQNPGSQENTGENFLLHGSISSPDQLSSIYSSSTSNDAFHLLTIDDAVEFMEMDVAPVTSWKVNPITEEQRTQEILYNTSFIRKHWAANPLQSESLAIPRTVARPYIPISSRCDSLIEELFGPGDPRRGKSGVPPKFRKPKLSSSSSAVDEDRVSEFQSEPEQEWDPIAPLSPESEESDDKLMIELPIDSPASVPSDSFHANQNSRIESEEAASIVGGDLLDNISSLALGDHSTGLSAEPPEEVLDTDALDTRSLSPQPQVVEPLPVSPPPQSPSLDDLQSHSFHLRDLSPDSPSFSFGEPHLLRPSLPPLTPDAIFNVDLFYEDEEPLASTTAIEEVTEDPISSTEADVDLISSNEVDVDPISSNEVVVESHPTPPSNTQDDSNATDHIITPSDASTSASVNRDPSPIPAPVNPLLSSVPLATSSKSSAWSKENLSALEERLGINGFDYDLFDEERKIGLRPVIPTDDEEEVWYEFREDDEVMNFGSDQEETPLFLPDDSESEEEEIIELSDNEMIPPVATLPPAPVSPDPTPSSMRRSPRRRQRSTTPKDKTDTSELSRPVHTTPSSLRKRRPFPSISNSLSTRSQAEDDIDSDDHEEDQLEEDSPTRMGPPPRKRAKLAAQSPSNLPSGSQSARKRRR